MNEGMLSVDGGEWSTLLSIVAWFLWKNHNAFVFQNAGSSRHELVASTLSWTKAYECRDQLSNLACSTQTTKGWQRPDVGLVKLNVNGSVSTANAKAAIGGVVCDSNGKWLIGFVMVIGMAEAF